MPSSLNKLLRLTIPVGMGYMPTGFAFGVLASQAGLHPLLIMGMSVFIYAGALQFAAVPLLAGGVGFSTAAITTLLINLRHVLYLAPLIDHLPRRWGARLYAAAALTDETYSLLTTLPPSDQRSMFLGICLVNQSYWVAGTAIGVGLGAGIGRFIPNLDFALPALFTILAIEQFLTRRLWVPALVGGIAFAIARTAVPDGALIVSLGLGLIALLLLPSPKASGQSAASNLQTDEQAPL